MDPITLTIAAAAINAHITPDLLLAVCWVETKHRNIVTVHDGKDSSLGACQVKPATARFIARKTKRRFYASDLLNVERNAEYAALYLKYQLNRYGGDVWQAVDAYNKGSSKKSRSNAKNARLLFDSCYTKRHSNCNNKYANDTRYVMAVKNALRSKPWTVENSVIATKHSSYLTNR